MKGQKPFEFVFAALLLHHSGLHYFAQGTLFLEKIPIYEEQLWWRSDKQPFGMLVADDMRTRGVLGEIVGMNPTNYWHALYFEGSH